MQHVDKLTQQVLRRVKPRSGVAPSKPVIRVARRYNLDDLDLSVHPKLKAAVDISRQWINIKRKCIQSGAEGDLSMVLSGDNGIGKTHIARSLCWAESRGIFDGDKFIPLMPVGNFIRADALMGRLRENNGQEVVRTMSKFLGNDNTGEPVMGCWCVVIDDVGDEGNMEYVAADDEERVIQSWYSRFIDACYQNTSVIITTNLTLPQLERRVGRRAWDRLMEMCPQGFMRDLSGVTSYRVRSGGRKVKTNGR